MKKLCIGSFFTIITQARRNKLHQHDLFCAILSCAEKSGYYEDSTLQGHLKSGKDDLSGEYTGKLRKKSIEEIEDYFDTEVTPLIDTSKKKALFLALRSVIAEDNIDDATQIGLREGYDKASILTKNTFSFSGFLANVYAYCALEVANKPYASNIQEIDKKNYVESFMDDTTPIHFDEQIKVAITPLTTTARTTNFDSIFTEVTHGESLAIPNSHQAKIYHLDVINDVV